MIIWLDGELIDVDDARISPLDRGLTVGDGVFETLRAYAGQPFAFTRHAARLIASADALGLALPAPETLRAACDAVLSANSLGPTSTGDARLRITITGGEGPPGSSRAGATSRAYVVAMPFAPGPPTTSVVVAPWTRNERSATAGLKTISYASNVRALAYAEQRGATEALFANTHDNLCEATGSNVFVVIDGQLRTPPQHAGCLLGVTRALLLELAHELEIDCAETDIPMDALPTASEVFLSSTTREVQSVTAIDAHAVANAPGVVAQRLADAYVELVARTHDP